MTNTSIKTAFSQFWKHVVARISDAITSANNYTDTKVSALEKLSIMLVARFIKSAAMSLLPVLSYGLISIHNTRKEGNKWQLLKIVH